MSSEAERLRRRIHRERLLPWLSDSHAAWHIGPWPTGPLTLRSLADLSFAQNSFVEEPYTSPDGDLLAYIWRHLPAWRAGYEHTRAGRRAFRRFIKRAARVHLEAIRYEALEHMRLAISEGPELSQYGGTRIDHRLPPIPAVAALAERAAAAYGLDPSAVAQWPLQKLYQCLRSQNLRTLEDCSYGDHPELVELKTRWLQAKNPTP